MQGFQRNDSGAGNKRVTDRPFSVAFGRHSGTRPALADDVERLTHARLRDESQRAAGRIRDEFGTGAFVVIRAEPSVRFVVTLFGTMYSGNTPVPIDPRTPETIVGAMLDSCNTSRVLAPLSVCDFEGFAPLDAPDSNRPALVMFTSGTTGAPKGVIMTHRNLARSCDAVSDYLRYREFPTSLSILPLHYSYGLIAQLLAQLYIGGYVRIMAGLRNPLAFCRAVADERIETFCGVPSTFLTLAKFHRLAPIELPTLRVVCSAGAAFEASVYDTIKMMCPNATVFNNYGMTEACPRLAYISDRDERFISGCVGRPMAGVEAIVIEDGTGRRLPDGERGILAVRGPNICPGYLNDAKSTRAAFTEDGFLITGDVAHLDAGYIYIHGRVDDMFNVAGEKVSPLEIEAVINRLPEVECSAVVGMRDTVRGSVPVAFLKTREPVSASRITGALTDQLTPNKLPVAYYEVAALPMTPNGKIQRRSLEPRSELVIRKID